MNILILGDSLTFSRRNQKVNEAWPSLLQYLLKEEVKTNPLFWFRARGGSDICSVINEIQDLSAYVSEKEFDISIVQVGIVDCTPRPYSKLISRILNSNKIGLRIKVFVHNHLEFFYLFHSSPDISEKMWKKKIEEAAMASSQITKKTIFVSIAPPGEILCKKVPKIESIIKKYNEILFSTIDNINKGQNIAVINPYEQNYFDVKTDIMENCGHHLTVTGHHKVSKKVYEFICAQVLQSN